MALPFQALMAEHRKDVLLESQARAVEYGQMFSYSELRPQLLEHMPPLDAAAYARSAAAAGKLDTAPAELVRGSQVARNSGFLAECAWNVCLSYCPQDLLTRRCVGKLRCCRHTLELSHEVIAVLSPDWPQPLISQAIPLWPLFQYRLA